MAVANALIVSLDYLMGEQDMALEGIDFRKKQITSKKEQAQIQAKAFQLIERYLSVERALVAGHGAIPL
jgi:hypothetical protein